MLLLLFLLLSLVHVSAVFAAVDGSCCCCFCCCRWFRQGLWLQHPLDKEGKLALGYGKPHDHDPNKMVKQKYKSQPSTQVRSVKGGGDAVAAEQSYPHAPLHATLIHRRMWLCWPLFSLGDSTGTGVLSKFAWCLRAVLPARILTGRTS
jgi:hypothetical protein